jgi:hypothetical protein
MTAPFLPESPEDFDAEFAADLVGCTLLIGITYVDPEGQVLDQDQVFGTVASCTLEDGLVLRLPDGSEFVGAPATSWIEPAKPGQYRLRKSGDVVTNPDYMMTVFSEGCGSDHLMKVDPPGSGPH